MHDLHVWTLSSDLYALSSHVIVDGHPTLEAARVVGERVKGVLRVEFHIDHATLELECEPCHESDHDPCGVNDVNALASHTGHDH